MSGRSCYDALSPVYDRFNGDVDYSEIAGAITGMFKRFSKKKIKTVLDLGCGVVIKSDANKTDIGLIVFGKDVKFKA